MLNETEIKAYYTELYEQKQKYMNFINDPNIKLHTELYYLKRIEILDYKLSVIMHILYPLED